MSKDDLDKPLTNVNLLILLLMDLQLKENKNNFVILD